MRLLLFTKVLILASLLSACTPSHSGPDGSGGKPGDEKPKENEFAPFFAKPETIDYQVIREKVLSFPCMKCHDSKSPTKNDEAIEMGADMTDYASLFVSIAGSVIEKGNPEESFIYKAVAGPKKNMPPKKSGLPKLSDDQIKLMRLWILNCAIESKAALGEDDKLVENPENPDKVRECEKPAEEGETTGAETPVSENGGEN